MLRNRGASKVRWLLQNSGNRPKLLGAIPVKVQKACLNALWARFKC
jgi:hypothetical protein